LSGLLPIDRSSSWRTPSTRTTSDRERRDDADAREHQPKVTMYDQDFPTVTTIMLAITVTLIIVLAAIALW
jgi:hypothetical protein